MQNERILDATRRRSMVAVVCVAIMKPQRLADVSLKRVVIIIPRRTTFSGGVSKHASWQTLNGSRSHPWSQYIFGGNE